MWPNLTKVEQTGSRGVSTFTRRPRRHDGPRPLLELPPPAAAVTLVPRSCWTPTGHHFRSAQGSSRTSRQGAFGRQLCTRAERRARGGAAQQHLGDRLRRWSGHQDGQRGVPGAGLPGWYNVGTQRKVWRRRGWEHFWEKITITATFGVLNFTEERSNVRRVTMNKSHLWFNVTLWKGSISLT